MPTALVTGSAKGIGKAILLALAQKGYSVAVHYQHSKEEAEEVAKLARNFGVKTLCLQADLRDPEEAKQLVTATQQHFGTLDVLVNNVGNYHYGPLKELSVDVWHEMFNSNLHSTFYTSQAAVPFMRKAGGGRIVNIGYAGAEHLVARPNIVAYGIAKTGVILYSKALAKTEIKHNITVNVVSPGVIENSISQPLSEIPIGRSGKLDELVGAVMYFLSPEAAYVTGVTLEVSGGWNL
jgi:NAD(P)-dependent dehydrogenase (short-subunit alcohol dehydrogenase family)